MGVIEQGISRIIIKIMTGGKVQTFDKLILKRVLVGTLILTAGHPPYRVAINIFLCLHQVVNQSKRFKNHLVLLQKY
ncbi:hypothetical protein AAJ76_205000249 [Vairimorpha ceranae]|uniref:Uncharacterized protein n=1 Tax=Vairimorpha ceranae TaxID=40302 RepID=A0A0F9W7Y1_9MICR|nr:hypothetical protein AAJ76_205000249 [Vairimorpha ceranae]KKO73846.1 hypothetical protein AAJ76_205000249 [Vairimorpha ceranae]